MDPVGNESTFENLMETGEELDGSGVAYDPSTITHAMITADGQTVPITLNPNTGEFLTPDGQTVQVQMASEEGADEYMEQAESVLPDQSEEVDVSMEQSEPAPGPSYHVISQPQVQTSQPQVVVKQEQSFPQIIEQPNNIQVLSGDGQMYFVTSDSLVENSPTTIQMVTPNESVEAQSKIRIVNASEEPKRIITINNQQYILSQGNVAKPITPQVSRPKVVIRPAIAPKTEPKVQYVKVRPMQQQGERKIVTISGSGMPILPKENVVKIALPTAPDNRVKAQRIILPSESVKVLEPQISRKIVSMDNSINIVPKIEPSSHIVTSTFETPKLPLPPGMPEKPPADMFETTGVKPRKPCNCTKSQCLKLYCECFANGEFCHNCNCNNCFNNLGHEEARQRSIKQCLERNPNAFRPKIGKLNNETGERKHNKGCNCKRSGCLKNYCECYEAKIGCTKNCRCIGCKNIDVTLGHRRPDPDLSTSINVSKDDSGSNAGTLNLSSSMASSKKGFESHKVRANPLLQSVSGNAFRPVSGVRQPFNFVTNEVVEATCQCLLAQAEDAERTGRKEDEIEGLIIEEFGRCLSQIIEMANKSIC